MSVHFMIEMAWKSALISALALAAGAAMKGRAGADRSLLLKSAVVLLLALPAAAIWLPQLALVTQTVEVPRAGLEQISQIAAPVHHEQSPTLFWSWSNFIELAGLIWATGCAALVLRLACGVVLLARMSEAGREAESPIWRDGCVSAAAAANYHRSVLVRVADVPAPLHWGWRKPVILIDPVTYSSLGDAESVLAHEFAHIARRDWPAIILARLAVAVFWPNPLVWLLERRLVDAIEEAADASAVQSIEPRQYAQSLLNCASKMMDGSVPAIGIADRGLFRRLQILLDGKPHLSAPNPRQVGIVVMGVAALAMPIAAVRPMTTFVYPASRQIVDIPPGSSSSAAKPNLGDLREARAGKRARLPQPALIESIPHATPNGISEEIQTPGMPGAKSANGAIPVAVAMKSFAVQMDSAPSSSPDSRQGSGNRRVFANITTRSPRDIGGQVTDSVLAHLGRDFLRRADQLDAEAARFRSKPYRDSLIAEAAANGRPVTDEQLLARMSKMESDAIYLREHSFGQAQRAASGNSP